MKKNEYVSPELEIVEITEQGSLLIGSGGDLDGPTIDTEGGAGEGDF